MGGPPEFWGSHLGILSELDCKLNACIISSINCSAHSESLNSTLTGQSGELTTEAERHGGSAASSLRQPTESVPLCWNSPFGNVRLLNFQLDIGPSEPLRNLGAAEAQPSRLERVPVVKSEGGGGGQIVGRRAAGRLSELPADPTLHDTTIRGRRCLCLQRD